MVTINYDIVQGSDEWFEARKGKMTASNATAIKANGKGLNTYCRNIAAELKGAVKKQFQSDDIDRGNELEAIGVLLYEMEFNVSVKSAGFIENSKYKNVLASPDGLVGEEGGIEIKARNDEKHFSLICGDESEIPVNQIQFTLMVSERKWWDFVSVNTNFEKAIFVKRIYPNEKYFEAFIKGIESGEELIDKYVKMYDNYKPTNE